MSDFDLIAFDSMTRLRANILSSNIEEINATLAELRDNLDDETFQAKTGSLFRDAIEKNEFQLVDCYLRNYASINSQLIVKATRNTSYQILELFLNYGWDINMPIDSYSPPAIAFSFHDSDFTQWFLAHGADPNRRSHEYTDCTPLSIAFKEADFAIIQTILDHGASLRHGQIIHYAAMRELDDRLEVLTYLLDRKHDSVNNIMYENCGDEYYFHMFSGIGTPLHHAAAGGLLDSVKLLVQYGALPRMRDPAGQTAAEWAKMHGRKAIFDFLNLYL
ncbi:uncharacterized protein N7483_009941 [Penicillium malachiteum]|uniref:uncharacterized protein n=1 Tax=Penicillium malachiteum TaxID=1324776 RepID=UPI002546B16A|nr:uncharacterized protein N7483_009941 [Penicillium malachiteum]KAJ5718859.1 hypothetical protein N7483_009941 [Penicillium malachiteum]